MPLIALSGLLLHAPMAASAPDVLVSIQPIHSLVAAIMQGVGNPELLIRDNRSPHDYSLKPSDMRLLQHADLVIWVGPEVETPLSQVLAKSRLEGAVVTLTQMDGVGWLPSREGGEWEAGHVREAHHHDPGAAFDSHIWLSPAIARRIVSQVTDRLCEMDGANAARYRQNSRQLAARLERLDTQLASMLSSVRDVPYVVFHDAYHYFERHYGLHAVGSVSVSPERQPGARHVHELRAKIIRLQARCVFSEPQFRPKLVATLIEGTTAKAGQLDPLGNDLEAGPEAYFQLMRRLAQSMLDCLR